MNITFPVAILSLAASALFGAGGFWLLTNFRLTKLESNQSDNNDGINDIRERLARMETKLDYIKTRA